MTRILLVAASITLAASLSFGQAKYALLLKNGYVIDPKNGVSERRDLAISGGLIAASEKSIDPSTATRVVDVTGLYVTPGLVDIDACAPRRHRHVESLHRGLERLPGWLQLSLLRHDDG
jgi:adenine deaminase